MSAGSAVADSWAVLALLQGEGQAAQNMRRWLRRAGTGNVRLLLCIVNLGEVYYRVAQRRGEERADEALDVIEALPIEIVAVKRRLLLEAARLKARHPISYADAFCVATARLSRAPVLTGDPEILELPRDVVAVRRLAR